MSGHAPGRLHIVELPTRRNAKGLAVSIESVPVEGVAEYRCIVPHVGREDAARLVACWNACEGIDPEAVPDMLAACEGLLVRHRCLGCGPLGGRHGSGCASAIAEAAIARARGGR